MVVSGRFSWTYTGSAQTWYSDYSENPYGKIFLGSADETFFVKRVRISMSCIVVFSPIPVHNVVSKHVVNAQMILRPIKTMQPYAVVSSGAEIGSLEAAPLANMPIGQNTQYTYELNDYIRGFDIAAWSVALNANSAVNNIARFFVAIDWE